MSGTKKPSKPSATPWASPKLSSINRPPSTITDSRSKKPIGTRPATSGSSTDIPSWPSTSKITTWEKIFSGSLICNKESRLASTSINGTIRRNSPSRSPVKSAIFSRSKKISQPLNPPPTQINPGADLRYDARVQNSKSAFHSNCCNRTASGYRTSASSTCSDSTRSTSAFGSHPLAITRSNDLSAGA